MGTTVLDWSIDNFLDQTDQSIISPLFIIPEHPQIEWRLRLFPCGDCHDNSDFVSVYLSKMTVEFEAEIDFEVAMLGTDAQAESKTSKHVFDSEKNLTARGWPKFASRSRLVKDLLVDGNLKVQVKIVRVLRAFQVKDCLNATVFNWDIDDFLSKTEAKLTSDKFIIPGQPLIKWQLICYPKGIVSNDGNLKVYIQKCTDDCEIELEFRMTLVGRGKRLSRIYKSNFKNPNDDFNFSLVAYQDLLKHENFLIDGMLKIQFKVFRVGRVVYQDNHLNYCCNKLSLDFDSADKHCDFRLRVFKPRLQANEPHQVRVFDVHKYVLARESPYFKTMFESGLKENEENEVDLSQFHENVIQEVLRFLYTGQLHNFDKISDELIFAADYFQMDYLKILCQENMSFCLSLDNCLEFLRIADEVKAEPLKNAAMGFLNKNKSHLNKQSLIKFFKEQTELGVDWMLWRSS